MMVVGNKYRKTSPHHNYLSFLIHAIRTWINERELFITNSINTSFKAVTNTASTSGGTEIAQLRAKLKDLFVKVKEVSLRKDLDAESKRQILQSYQDQIRLIMQQIEALQSKTSKQQPSSPDVQVTETEKPAPSNPGMQAGIDTFA